MNFLALEIIAEFDDLFLLPFMKLRYRIFAGLVIPFRGYRDSKIVIKDQFIMPKEIHEKMAKEMDGICEVVEEKDPSEDVNILTAPIAEPNQVLPVPDSINDQPDVDNTQKPISEVKLAEEKTERNLQRSDSIDRMPVSADQQKKVQVVVKWTD